VATELIRKIAREALAQGHRQPYTLDIRAVLAGDILATISGTLILEMIDAAEGDEIGGVQTCHGGICCGIWAAMIVPPPPICCQSGLPIHLQTLKIIRTVANATTAQVQGYIARSNS
jgi:hypothetical protein